MSRPFPNTIASGQASWDVDINATTNVTFNTPFPPHQVNDKTALDLLSPAAYDRCIAATISPPALWLSDGTIWRRIASGGQTALANSSAPSVSGTAADTSVNNAVGAVQSVLNNLITRCETAGLLLP